MKPLNFIDNENNQPYRCLVDCCIRDFEYKQVKDILEDCFDVYLPEDQFIAFDRLLNIQIDLDIGDRCDEYE